MKTVTALHPTYVQFEAAMFHPGTQDPRDEFESLPSSQKGKYASTYLRMQSLYREAQERVCNETMTVGFTLNDVRETSTQAGKELPSLLKDTRVP